MRCDQAKPLCARCTSTGRSCDGYTVQQVKSPIIPRQLDHRLPGTDEERSHFHFFASTILANLPPFFDFGFWDSDYLQACNAYPALFHASAAMAAVHRLMICQHQGSSDLDQDLFSNFLLRQFNQSIKHVGLAIRTGRNEDRAFILATCIVFTCLSAFQGRYLEAMGHVRSGLRILHSCRSLANSGTASPIPWETLFILLTRLDTQAHCLQSPICGDDTATILQFERDFLTDGLDRPLQSFLQLYSKIEFLCNSALRLVRRRLWKRADVVVEDRSFYLASFNLWKTKLSTYLADIRISVPVLAVISCEIRIAFTDALLKYDSLKAELGWDDITEQFERVIGLATHMLENDEHASRLYSRPVYKSTKNTSAVTSRHSRPAPALSSAQPMTLTAGVSDILYFVALHCREPRIRCQAIHILKGYPRREGICHTMLLGRVAEAVMEDENKCHCHQDAQLSEGESKICGLHRIRDVQIVSVDDGKRLAEASLRTVERFEASRSSSSVLVHW